LVSLQEAGELMYNALDDRGSFYNSARSYVVTGRCSSGLRLLSDGLAVDKRCLRGLLPVPMNIVGDELQPGHTSIRVHVEDDTRWGIAEEILGVGLWK
jgi:hypothetical protein